MRLQKHGESLQARAAVPNNDSSTWMGMIQVRGYPNWWWVHMPRWFDGSEVDTCSQQLRQGPSWGLAIADGGTRHISISKFPIEESFEFSIVY